MEPIKTISALAITFGLLGGFVWLLRYLSLSKGRPLIQWSRQPRERHLQSVERLALGPDCTLHLVALDGETILLAVSAKAVVPIQPLATRPKAFHTTGGVA
ncbi:MAG: hypothetical protein B7X34_09480 [Acidobacteriia bacterium 12-62-4]|nr:MAG: hypothetical protein B7X34_09480 [Acidobacteriia bacterium 12-62-4]